VSTDRLVFEDALGHRLSAPWAGAWPPPERLYLVKDGESTVLVDPDTQQDGTLNALVLDHEAYLFRRISFSEIGEPATANENWFRGALYQPWRFGDGGGR